MKRAAVTCAVIFTFFFLFQDHSSAQGNIRWRGSGGWGPGGEYARLYNPSSVEKLRGMVILTGKFSPDKGMFYGIHLLLETQKGEIPVHLGPAWFLENQDVAIVVKDIIRVKGSRIIYHGKDTIIAAEITKGEKVLRLRDESGFPLWSGWKRK